MAARDMTRKQFKEACKKYGFKSDGFLGYFRLPGGKGSTSVSILNAGSNRRAQLAYLLQENDKAIKREKRS